MGGGGVRVNHLRAAWLFVRIAWRPVTEQDGIVYRLSIRTAWQIAARLHIGTPYPEER